MDVANKLLVIYSIRGLCLLLFIYNSSWNSLLYGLACFASIYYLPTIFGQGAQSSKPAKPVKVKHILQEYYPDLSQSEQDRLVTDEVMKLVAYDVEDNPCLANFEVVKRNSNCLFARKAKIWGSPAWDEQISLAGNMFKMLPMFLKFTIVCSSQRLDGFLVQLPGETYGHNIQTFGDGLRDVLKFLSDNDPAGIHCMNRSYVGKRGWVFEFNNVTFFITTFAPFYPETHARYSFGAGHCYILFQPELSFAHHDLPPDTPITEWEEPKTVRDKIRHAFKEAGRTYTIPENVSSPMALEMLRPIHEGDVVHDWWKQDKR